MAFTELPTLPDYKKLKAILNQSGVQRSNPEIFDIIGKLIDAVGKSQSVFNSTIIPASGLSSLLINPAGAIGGDGKSIGLKVNVDGSTVTINGSDQLVASVTGVQLFAAVINNFHLSSTGDNLTAQQFLANAIPAVAGKVIIPFIGYLAASMAGSGVYTTNVGIGIAYTGSYSTPVMTSSTSIVDTVNFANTSIMAFGTNKTLSTTVFDSLKGVGVDITFGNFNASHNGSPFPVLSQKLILLYGLA